MLWKLNIRFRTPTSIILEMPITKAKFEKQDDSLKDY